MRKSTPPINSVARALAVMEAVLADEQPARLQALAKRLEMPLATVHRHVVNLTRHGMLQPSARGALVPGPRLRALAQRIDERQLLTQVAAPLLDALARRLRCVAQLGTLDADMVTYRVKTGHGAAALFSKVGLQLEAYCTGIGKVLLAHLGEEARESYLAGGPFPALTPHTLTSPDALRAEFARIRTQGFAVDAEEAAPELSCLAVPLRDHAGDVFAAISISRKSGGPPLTSDARSLAALRQTAQLIEAALYR